MRPAKSISAAFNNMLYFWRMNLKTAKVVFWIGLIVTLAIIPLIARPISYDAIFLLPLGAGLALSRKISSTFDIHGTPADNLLAALIFFAGFAQILLLFVISFTQRHRTFFTILAILLILLLLDINGCKQTLEELSHIS